MFVPETSRRGGTIDESNLAKRLPGTAMGEKQHMGLEVANVDDAERTPLPKPHVRPHQRHNPRLIHAFDTAARGRPAFGGCVATDPLEMRWFDAPGRSVKNWLPRVDGEHTPLAREQGSTIVAARHERRTN